MQELRWALYTARELLINNDSEYESIASAPRVLAKPDPALSAWAIYIQELLSGDQRLILQEASGYDLVPIGLVFDSVYCMSSSNVYLLSAFVRIQDKLRREHNLDSKLKDAAGSKIDIDLDYAKEVLDQHAADNLPATQVAYVADFNLAQAPAASNEHTQPPIASQFDSPQAKRQKLAERKASRLDILERFGATEDSRMNCVP